MSATNTNVASEAMAAMAVAVRGWDGTPDGAATLREQMRGLPAPRGKFEGDGGVMAKVRSCYEQRNGDKVLSSWLRNNPSDAALVVPFIGDVAAGAWPFHDALAVDDDLALLWLDHLARHPIVVDDRVRSFVRVMWRTRTRTTWVVASQTFAVLALRDEDLREELRQRWSRWFGNAWPVRWNRNALPQAPTQPDRDPVKASHEARDGRHVARHLIHLGCAWLARGGEPGVVGWLAPEQVVRTSMPSSDDSDASAVLLGYLELLAGDGRAAVLRDLPTRVRELEPAAQVLAALRDIAVALDPERSPEEAVCRAAVIAYLTEVAWHEAPTIFQDDLLLESLRTARWLAERNERAALDALRRHAGPAARALTLALGEAPLNSLFPDPVVTLCEHIETLSTPMLRETLPAGRRAVVLAELLELIGHDELAVIPWPKVVERALGEAAARRAPEGELRVVALDDVIIRLSESGFPVTALLRTARIGATAVVSMAGVQDKVLARQVAVQMERLLREAEFPAAQVRLLWRLLREDPPTATLDQLQLVLRGEDTLLHELVVALREVDTIRTASQLETMCGPVVKLAAAASSLLACGEPRSTDKLAAQSLSSIAAEITKASGERPELVLHGPSAGKVGTATVRPNGARKVYEMLRGVLLGQGAEGGIVHWAAWLAVEGGVASTVDDSTLRARVTAELSALEQAIGAVEDAIPVVEEATHERVASAVAALRAEVARVGWPEGLVPTRLLEETLAWSEAQLASGRAARVQAAHTDAVLDRADVDKAVAIASPKEDEPDHRGVLPASVARRLHGFLLDNLHFGAAQALRSALAGRVQLPHWLSHLAPLLAGVMGGAFLVLDVGDDWIDLANDESKHSYALWTMVLTFVGAYGLILADLAAGLRWRRAADDASRTRRRWGVLWRGGLVVVGSWVVALGVSLVVMWTLGKCDAANWGLRAAIWSFLSLFLGVFLGLVLQGRRTRRGE